MPASNHCFLTCIHAFQEAGKVVFYSHLFKNFPQFVVIHIVKGFSIVTEAEVDVFFWNSLVFSMSQQMLVVWSLVPLPFLNPACTSGNSWFIYCWSLSWRILSITLLACEMNTIVCSLNILWHCPSLGLQWKLTFSSLAATAEFSKFAGILSAALSQHHLSGFERAQLETSQLESPPLALFIVMLRKSHLTSHSWMSGSRWVITPSWLSESF